MLAMRVAAPFISLRVAYHNCPLEAHRISGNVICKVTVYYLNWSIWLLLLVIPFKIHPQILWNCPPPDPNTPRTLIPFVSGTVVTRNVAWATSWTTKGIFAERNRISHTVPPPTRKVTASFRLVIHHEGRFHTGALKQVRRELLPGLKIRTRQGNLSVFSTGLSGLGPARIETGLWVSEHAGSGHPGCWPWYVISLLSLPDGGREHLLPGLPQSFLLGFVQVTVTVGLSGASIFSQVVFPLPCIDTDYSLKAKKSMSTDLRICASCLS